MSHTIAFRFQALRQDGSTESGIIEASDRQAALAAITSRGLFPTEMAQRRQRLRRISASATDLALGLRSLANLLSSGLPLARALAVLEDVAPAAWSPAIPSIRARIDEGMCLADSLTAARMSIPDSAIGMMRAGEVAGDAAAAVEAAAALLEKRASDIAAFRNALAYPLLLVLAGGRRYCCSSRSCFRGSSACLRRSVAICPP